MSEEKKPKAENDIPRSVDFENQLAELEKIVTAMEQGDMTLEESLQAYEKGVKLTRECQIVLDSAQQRIAILSEKNGLSVEEPFDGSA